MTLFLDIDDDNDVIVSAIAESLAGETIGDMHFPVSPGMFYNGVPYSVLRRAAPGEFTLEELQELGRDELPTEERAIGLQVI